MAKMFHLPYRIVISLRAQSVKTQCAVYPCLSDGFVQNGDGFNMTCQTQHPSDKPFAALCDSRFDIARQNGKVDRFTMKYVHLRY